MVCIWTCGEEVAYGAGEPVPFVGGSRAAPGVLDCDVQGGPEGEEVPDAVVEGFLEALGGGGELDAAAWGGR